MDTPALASIAARPPLSQTDTDRQTIGLWLHNRSPHTQRAYLADVNRFLSYAGKPLVQITLADLAAFSDSLAPLRPVSRNRILSSVRSLLAFAHKIGYLPFDVGRPVRLQAVRDRLAERILPEADVHKMLWLEPKPRNKAILTLLYAGGLRCQELCDLEWNHLQPHENGDGQATVFGKGGKTRAIHLRAEVFQMLMALKPGEDASGPVFRSQKKRAIPRLGEKAIWSIVRKAALRAGIRLHISPHWLRHAHGSHALDRGAPLHLVQATLGHSSVATTGQYLHARPQDSSERYLAIPG